MAYFAKINDSNIVENVFVTDDSKPNKGLDYLQSVQAGDYIEADKAARTTGFRKHFPSAGDKYDAQLDAFIPQNEKEDWIFDEQKWCWVPPISLIESTEGLS